MGWFKACSSSDYSLWFGLLLVLLTLPASALAQIGGQGSIVGTVRDQSRGVLPGVEVTVLNVNTGTTRQVLTNDSGLYIAERLQPGEYQVSAQLAGFKRQTIKGVVLQVAERARVDLELEVGEVQDEVTVAGNAAMIQTDTATISSTIDDEKVRLLPLNGRNFLQLSLLSPGAVDAENSILAHAKGTVSVNGYGDVGNNFILDGTSNSSDATAGRMNFAPSLELIQEFKVQTSVLNAEYGRAGGAQINIVTKRGQRDYHGSLFIMHRNDNFDARNFFQTGEIPEFRRSDFGGSVGGPIIPGQTDPKHFFFFAWESRRQGRGLTVTTSVPTAAMKGGDFSAFDTIIYDPATLDPATGQRQPFPGNRIPDGRIAPQAKFFNQFYPDPLLPGTSRNFVANPTQTWDTDQYSIRYDADFSTSDTLMARFTFNNDEQFQPLGVVPVASPFEGFGEIGNFEGRNYQVSWTHTFGPNMINTFSGGFGSFLQDRTNEQTGRNVFEEAGIQGVTGDVATGGFPWIRISGFQTIGDDPFAPIRQPSDSWEWADTLTQITGNHSLKYGFNLILNSSETLFHAADRGWMVFSPQFSTSAVSAPGDEFNAFAEYLLGFPSSTFRRSDAIRQSLSQYWAMGFVQDDWNIHPDVTLNLGLRYELWRRPIEDDNRMSILEIYRLPQPEFLIAGSPEAEAVGLPRSLDESDKNDFGPRLGFAWRMGGNDNWVLRGGYGLMYQWIVLDKQLNLGIGPPFLENISITSNFDQPSLTMVNPYDAGPLPSTSGNAIPLNNRTPYNQHYSLTLAHEINPSLGIEIGYVGSAARKNFININENQPRPGPGPAGPRSPFPNLASINAVGNWGTSHYDSLQIQVRKDPGVDGLSLLGSYTWGKSLATSRPGGTQHFSNPIRDMQNWKADAGPSSFDVRQRFSLSYLYELPFGRGRTVGADVAPVVNQIIGGWRLGGIITLQSGNFLTPSSIFNFSNSGGSRPNLVGDPNTGPKTVDQWFNINAFADAEQFTFGNSGVGIIEGPGFAIFDLSFYKDFIVTEGQALQFRLEMFNAFNHTNFLNPNTSFGAGSFGQIGGARDARQVQFGLRYDF